MLRLGIDIITDVRDALRHGDCGVLARGCLIRGFENLHHLLQGDSVVVPQSFSQTREHLNNIGKLNRRECVYISYISLFEFRAPHFYLVDVLVGVPNWEEANIYLIKNTIVEQLCKIGHQESDQ